MDRIIGLIILVVILIFLVDGVRRGLVRQIFEIVGLVAAFVGAYYTYHYFAAQYRGSTQLAHHGVTIAATIVVFVVVALVFHLIGMLLGKIASVTVLGPVDRIGGGLLGAIKGVLFVSLLCVLCFSLPFPDGFKEKLKRDPVASRVYPVLPKLYDSVVRHPPAKAPVGNVARAPMK
jgi:uncharacterized membrane protein required for colicin V production